MSYIIFYEKDCEVYGKHITVSENEELSEVIKETVPLNSRFIRVDQL